MKVKKYKQYSNLLNKMKAKAKEKYYNQFPAAQRKPDRNMQAYWYNH